MSKKLMLIINLLIIISLLYGCSTPNGEIFPTTIPLEQSIKEIIVSKGSNYDFLNDELFQKKVDEFANSIIKKNTGSNKYYTIGNLDDDNIPELVIFIERNPNDVDDQGGLGVYKFNGEKYELIDQINMNYDNTNHLLVIGKLSPVQNGILISNQVGAHSSITYGFILKDNKLKNILNEKKVHLLSVYPNNEIKDIDGDGILEFSIYTNDPESEDQSSVGSDKLILWYKWDENDSANLLKVIKESSIEPNKTSKEKDMSLMEISEKPTLEYIKNNINQYSKNELSFVLEKYINDLVVDMMPISDEVNSLFDKYQKGNNFNFLIDKYDLSIDRLNDMDYLKREKILQSELELKEHLLNHIQMGYKLDSSEGVYYYIIDYQNFINNFTEFITNEFRDYLKIKAMETNEPYLRDDSFVITRDKLSERIIAIERFKLTYPYSKKITEINSLYELYVKVLLYGSGNTPNYDENVNKFSDGSIAVFNNIANKYPDSYLAEIIQTLINNLTLNMGTLNDSVKKIIDQMIK